MLKNFKWFPWPLIVSRVARAHGFIDPISVMAKLRNFAQPSEVAEPLELLRAGVVFHARGLMNTRAIQHNLDWVWPYWVERQFDPTDCAFIPRAFSVTHVNLTHRNWTAVGVPDVEELAIVDPRGLVMPRWDGWCLDAWVVARGKFEVIPSKLADVEQTLTLGDSLSVTTTSRSEGAVLSGTVRMTADPDEGPVCRIEYRADAPSPAWLVVSVRPYNPEGVSFIHNLKLKDDRTWIVDGSGSIDFENPVERHLVSNYRKGDVYYLIRHPEEIGDEARELDGSCDIGMLTGAAMYRIEPGLPRTIRVSVPVGDARASAGRRRPPPRSWREATAGSALLELPNDRHQFLYDAAIRTLVLHSPDDVYPGPYTYKRFWFRDAAFMIQGLLALGFAERAKRAISNFAKRQTKAGYFLSQEGEWDSNGEALWTMEQYVRMTGEAPPDAWRESIERGARWIEGKRIKAGKPSPHTGLFPAGFSAEHLGLNDYYYWDDFWGVAGLRAAAFLLERYGDSALAGRYRAEAEEFLSAIDRSIEQTNPGTPYPAIPASPYRRMDAGAIGSVVASYPLRIAAPADPRVLNTARFLMENCFHEGAFFQDMIHSGVNAYLTIHLAQVLLRAGDSRFAELVERVGALASPTGQWPEAIHPHTLGGCMGDGQHAWAAVEWVLMVRACFVREENGSLVLCSGILPSWLETERPLRFGPTPTSFGPITVRMDRHSDGWRVSWEGDFRMMPNELEVRLPGSIPVGVKAAVGSVTPAPLGAAA